MKESFGGMFPIDRFEEMSKQNMAFFEQAMRMWNPFKAGAMGMPGMPGASSEAATPAASKPAEAPSSSEISDLKNQMLMLQRQIEALTKSSASSSTSGGGGKAE